MVRHAKARNLLNRITAQVERAKMGDTAQRNVEDACAYAGHGLARLNEAKSTVHSAHWNGNNKPAEEYVDQKVCEGLEDLKKAAEHCVFALENLKKKEV